uniref:Acyl-coenzyme A thioesterase 13 n=2 Tax=Urocitellus parryii TaxID=9999 RepID=A0A8D2H2M4_UROPR
ICREVARDARPRPPAPSPGRGRRRLPGAALLGALLHRRLEVGVQRSLKGKGTGCSGGAAARRGAGRGRPSVLPSPSRSRPGSTGPRRRRSAPPRRSPRTEAAAASSPRVPPRPAPLPRCPPAPSLAPPVARARSAQAPDAPVLPVSSPAGNALGSPRPAARWTPRACAFGPQRSGRGPCPPRCPWLQGTSRPRSGRAWHPEARSACTMSGLMQNAREVMKALLRSPGFDRVLEKVTLVSAAPEKVICEMKVEEQHANKMGTLHGGLTATLIDSISTMALLCSERGLPGVSVDMNITYMSPAKIGEEIVITAQILKQGRTLAFASVDLTNKATGKLIAQGRHKKHLGN